MKAAAENINNSILGQLYKQFPNSVYCWSRVLLPNTLLKSVLFPVLKLIDMIDY